MIEFRQAIAKKEGLSLIPLLHFVRRIIWNNILKDTICFYVTRFKEQKGVLLNNKLLNDLCNKILNFCFLNNIYECCNMHRCEILFCIITVSSQQQNLEMLLLSMIFSGWNPVLQIRSGKRDNLGIIFPYFSFKTYFVTHH